MGRKDSHIIGVIPCNSLITGNIQSRSVLKKIPLFSRPFIAKIRGDNHYHTHLPDPFIKVPGFWLCTATNIAGLLKKSIIGRITKQPQYDLVLYRSKPMAGCIYSTLCYLTSGMSKNKAFNREIESRHSNCPTHCCIIEKTTINLLIFPGYYESRTDNPPC